MELLTLTILRKRVLLSQEDLAAMLERTTQPDVSTWESGRIAIPQKKRSAVLAALRKADGKAQAIDSRIRPDDLTRPWEEVLLELSAVQVA